MEEEIRIIKLTKSDHALMVDMMQKEFLKRLKKEKHDEDGKCRTPLTKQMCKLMQRWDLLEIYHP